MMGVGGLRVYLSGPMSGKPDDNRRAFKAARELLRRAGALEVFDPAHAWPPDMGREWYMRHDFLELARSKPNGEAYYDALVSLPHWEWSDGAWCERLMAEEFGIPCVDMEEVGGIGC